MLWLMFFANISTPKIHWDVALFMQPLETNIIVWEIFFEQKSIYNFCVEDLGIHGLVLHHFLDG